MELIRRYIKENDLAQASFARLVGLPRQDVNAYYHGRLGVSKNAARKMEVGTHGVLTVQALMEASLEIEQRVRALREAKAKKAKRSAKRKRAARKKARGAR